MAAEAGGFRCRLCGGTQGHTFVDLGKSPLCESYLTPEQLYEAEPFYPLRVEICEECFLAQLPALVDPEVIFRDYAYFSSYSESWVRHASEYADMAVKRFGLGPKSFVVEVASNDGYLLQHFLKRGIRCLGIEPARNVARAAEEKGIPTLVEFFDRTLAEQLSLGGARPDLLVGNNVLAQVPDLNDFLAGVAVYLAPAGVATFEFPHLMRLVEGNQFDTIYHEHFSYFSLHSARRAFEEQGLVVFDVEELPTHGGSLRVYLSRAGEVERPISLRVAELLAREEAAGLLEPDYYAAFGERVQATKRKLLKFLIRAKEQGELVAGYGAPGKGNTLLNYCGVRTDLLPFTVDRNPHKQGKFLPGTHIPIYHPDRIREVRPDYLLILPWNLREEIMGQMEDIRKWGGRFVVPIPEVTVFE